MKVPRTRREKDEYERRGDEIYDLVVAPRLKEEDLGKFVLMDIDSEDFEIDRDEIAASDRLLARIPDAQVWFTGPAPATRAASGRVCSYGARSENG